MLDSPHTSSPMLMRIPLAARFPPHQSRPTRYSHNRQPATVGAVEEELGGRGTTSSRTTTGAAPELRRPKSAPAGDAVFRTSTRGTVPMGQWAAKHLPLPSYHVFQATCQDVMGPSFSYFFFRMGHLFLFLFFAPRCIHAIIIEAQICRTAAL